MSIKEHPPHHVPVLLDSALSTMQPQPGESYLDLTAGYGGHASVFLSATNNYSASCLVDRDDFAISHLQHLKDKGTRLLHSDFLSAAQQLVAEKKTFDLILADLGVSSPQLDIAERGFSFKSDGPLDMRMDRSCGITAAEYVNTARFPTLIRDIELYGEESSSVAKRYATAIVMNRPFTTTAQLAQCIQDAHKGKWQRIHPATRTFQAIRIVVNAELQQVEHMLPLLPSLLNKGGRAGIISFHSLEDRLVKRYFAEQAKSGYEAELEIVTKKPRVGTEDVHNPRARSAKLRVAVKK